MALNLDTAIRLTAQVQGANNIRGIATNLQQLNSTAQLSGRQLDKLYTETQRFAAAAGNSINAIRQQRQALMTLRDAADPASRQFQLLTQDIGRLEAQLREVEATASASALAAALRSNAAGAQVSMVSFAGLTASSSAVAAALQRMGVSSTEAQRMVQGLQGQMEQATVSAQKLNLTLNQALGSTAEKATRQINMMRQALAQQKIGSDEYLATLVRINEAEAVMAARTGRAGVIAAARAYSGPTMTSGFGSEARLPGLPNTMAADMQRVSELTARIRNLDRATDEYRNSLRELEVVQARLNAQPLRLDFRGAAGSAAGALAMGGGPGAAIGAFGGSLAAAGGPAGIAAAAGLAATAGLTVQSVGNALALEEQSRRLRVMTEDSAALQAGIIALVREQGHLTSTTEATAAAYEILQAGFEKTEDVVSVLRASTLGATAGFTDVKTVADALTSVINGYGFSTSQASRLVDQMKAATDDGKISMEQYAQSIGRVIPSAAAAGVSFENINAFVSALTAQGVPVESTFAGINQVIKSIIKPTKEAAQLAEQLGLEFNAQALASKDLAGFLAEVAAKTGNSTDKLSILFSDIDGYKAVVSVLNDDLVKVNKSLDNQATAFGRSADAAKTAIDPIKQFDNAWKDLSATLGQTVLPAITETIKGLTALIQKMAGMDQISTLQRQLQYALPQQERQELYNEAINRAKQIARLRGQENQPLRVNELRNQIYADLLRDFGYRSGAMEAPVGSIAAAAGQTAAAPKTSAEIRASEIAKRLSAGSDDTADKAAKEAERQAKKLADHQRRINEELAQRAQQLAVQRYQNEMDMQDTLHRLSMQQIEEERQARRGLIEARADLAIAQAPESERWLLEFRRNLINVHTSTTDAILEQERKIADKRQELARAEARLRLAEMNERTQVIRTEMPRAAMSGIIARTGNTGQSTGPHLDARWADRRPITAADVDRYLRVNGRTPSSFGVTSGYGPRNLFGRSFHAGVDFGTPAGSQISLVNGAKMLRDLGNTGAGGYAIEIMTAQGPMRLLHLQAGSARAGAAPAAAPGGEMVTTLPPSQAGREAAQGEISRVRAELEAAEQGLAKLRTIASQTGAAQLGTVMVKQIQDITQPLDQLAKSAGDRLAFEREYGELLRTGINPELAREFVEINKIADQRSNMLRELAVELEKRSQMAHLTTEEKNVYIEQAKVARDLLSSQTQQVDKIKEELELQQEITRQRSLQQDMRIGQGAREGVEGYIQSIGTMREATAQLTQEGIRGLEDQLVSLATTGKANFQEFAVSVLTATARMIIQQMVLGTILRALSGIGGGGSQFAQSFQMPSAGFLTSGFSFAGGGYTGNAPRSGGLDGQGGFLAMLHPRETVVDHHKGQATAAGPTYVTVNVNTTTGETQSTATDSDRRRLGQDIAQVVDARIVHHRRPGGLLNPSRRN
jgi:TP901 family phage tail tape measure protein/lambda family phage tail tape measure protein